MLQIATNSHKLQPIATSGIQLQAIESIQLEIRAQCAYLSSRRLSRVSLSLGGQKDEFQSKVLGEQADFGQPSG